MSKDILYKLYSDKRTVFTLNEIAVLVDEPDFNRIKQNIHYYVRSKKIKNLRRGIYAKENYSCEELACKIYKPSYLSLEYALQKHGVIFQYHSGITGICYLSRTISIEDNNFIFRKIKNIVLIDTNGINMTDEGINIASPERAFLDTLYLYGDFYFDNISGLNKQKIVKMLPIYRSQTLMDRAKKHL